jgi:hypothetical protein
MKRCVLLSLILVMTTAWSGCASNKKEQLLPREYALASPYASTRTFAVAPAVNLSGSRDVDPLATSDQIFGELQQVQNLNVLPVNKTLAAMQQLQVRSIDSPQTALRVAELLGADALVVPAITAYDPYNPPTVGMILQLYANDTLAGPAAPVSRQINGAPLPGESAKPRQPVSQIAAIFNANNQTVLLELREFAKGRTDYQSALQEQRFLADSEAYTRFVCHAMIRRLMEVERLRASDR